MITAVGILGAVVAAQAGLGLFGSGSASASLATTAAQAVELAAGTLGVAWFAWVRLASRMDGHD